MTTIETSREGRQAKSPRSRWAGPEQAAIVHHPRTQAQFAIDPGRRVESEPVLLDRAVLANPIVQRSTLLRIGKVDADDLVDLLMRRLGVSDQNNRQKQRCCTCSHNDRAATGKSERESRQGAAVGRRRRPQRESKAPGRRPSSDETSGSPAPAAEAARGSAADLVSNRWPGRQPPESTGTGKDPCPAKSCWSIEMSS